MNIPMARFSALILVGGAVTLSGGCAATDKPITAEMLRKDLSLNMGSLAFTHDERLNNEAKSWHINWRNAVGTIDRIMFNDRPFRMSIHPIP